MPKRTSKPNSQKDFWTGASITHYHDNGRPETIFVRGTNIDGSPQDMTRFHEWLSGAKSFTFSRYANPVGDEWLITIRREKRANGTFWYAFKSHEGKTYKVYIGGDEAISLDRLKEAVEAMKDKINDTGTA